MEVRATNAEGTSDWSILGNGETNAPGANNLPVFDRGNERHAQRERDRAGGHEHR